MTDGWVPLQVFYTLLKYIVNLISNIVGQIIYVMKLYPRGLFIDSMCNHVFWF